LVTGEDYLETREKGSPEDIYLSSEKKGMRQGVKERVMSGNEPCDRQLGYWSCGEKKRKKVRARREVFRFHSKTEKGKSG